MDYKQLYKLIDEKQDIINQLSGLHIVLRRRNKDFKTNKTVIKLRRRLDHISRLLGDLS